MKRGITLSLLTPENLPKQRKKNHGSRVQICIVIKFEVTGKEVNCEKNPVISVHKMHDNSIPEEIYIYNSTKDDVSKLESRPTCLTHRATWCLLSIQPSV